MDNGAVLSVELGDGPFPPGVSFGDTFVIFDTSDPAYQFLSVGTGIEVVVPYIVADENGGTTSQVLTITVFGTNDAPVVESALITAATEGGEAVTLNLLDGASDVDDLDVLSVVLDETELDDGFTFDGTMLTIDPSNAAFEELAEGEELVVVVNYDVVDGNGGSASQSATITITGTNDAPTVASALSFELTEDTFAALAMLSGASDVDNGSVLSVTNVGTLPAA